MNVPASDTQLEIKESFFRTAAKITTAHFFAPVITYLISYAYTGDFSKSALVVGIGGLVGAGKTAGYLFYERYWAQYVQSGRSTDETRPARDTWKRTIKKLGIFAVASTALDTVLYTVALGDLFTAAKIAATKRVVKVTWLAAHERLWTRASIGMRVRKVSPNSEATPV